MAEFFLEYGLFALEALTVALAIAGLLILAVGLVSRSAEHRPDELELVRLDERMKREKETLESALMDDVAYRAHRKAKKAEHKATKKARKKELATTGKARGESEHQSDEEKRRVFVLDFEGDLQAHSVAHLRRELSALLPMTRSTDEVVVRLESPGGLVHAYGLAASQLQRVRDKGIKLTICVDKVAASGGYMMACVADQLLAAPFAVIGSIGVIAQLPNFHRLLEKHDVDFEMHTAGKFKRTLTLFGENTDKGREKFQEELEEAHTLFKRHVGDYRPQLDVESVATGEIWYGNQAVERGLIDALRTSDDYIADACEDALVLEVKFVHKKSLQDKLSSAFESSLERVALRLWQRSVERPFS